VSGNPLVPARRLFDLRVDPGTQVNLAGDLPDMTAQFDDLIEKRYKTGYDVRIVADEDDQPVICEVICSGRLVDARFADGLEGLIPTLEDDTRMVFQLSAESSSISFDAVPPHAPVTFDFADDSPAQPHIYQGRRQTDAADLPLHLESTWGPADIDIGSAFELPEDAPAGIYITRHGMPRADGSLESDVDEQTVEELQELGYL
jgi:hypothetical protein